MKFSIGVLCAVLFSMCGFNAANAAEGNYPKGEWVSLFNGKDLNGWTPKIRYYEPGDNNGDTFRVRDGLLQVRYDGGGYKKFGEKFGHLFYKDSFSNYRFRVEYRFVGEQCPEGPGWATRNSGVMIHGQDPKTMAKDQDFPVSIEVQLLGGNGKDTRTTSNLCTPGTNVVMNGELKAGSQVKLLHSGKTVEVKEVGSFRPKPYVRDKLTVGETGYFTANIKTPREVKVGDTITDPRQPAPELPGFQEIHPMVFSGIYPINTADYEGLKVAIAKLQLNDSALTFMAESSAALGFGLRCGFLGLLHMEIVQERLRREFDMDIIATYPSVIYKVKMTDGRELEVDNPAFLPDVTYIEHIMEPMVKAFAICPNECIGDIMGLIKEKRGDITNTETLDIRRVMLTAKMPMNEILIDFHDRIKSITRGYGSMDYEPIGYEISDMVKLDMMVNAEVMDAFSCLVHRDKAEFRGRALAAKLKEVIPKQQFAIAIQAAIGGKIVARETVGAMHKDVTAKCYGGDISRKRKLLDKQKEGKKRMKMFGTVNIPQEAFIEVLKT